MRKCLLGMAAVLIAAGGALADKPAALPIDPHVDGREPTPLVRDFHLADVPAAGSGSVERQQRQLDEQVRAVVLMLFFGR